MAFQNQVYINQALGQPGTFLREQTPRSRLLAVRLRPLLKLQQMWLVFSYLKNIN